MTEPIETLLFDFGGTLDADGVAWKERFYTLYRTEGLDMTADAFAPAFYAADSPLVGNLPSAADLSGTVHALAANLEAELARRRAPTHETETVDERTNSNRSQRVASRFLSDASAAFTRNRPVLEALRKRYRLGIVSNFYGNLEVSKNPIRQYSALPSRCFAHRPRKPCSWAIHCAGTARVLDARAWPSFGSHLKMSRLPKLRHRRNRPFILRSPSCVIF
jgi:hypothetical protein